MTRIVLNTSIVLCLRDNVFSSFAYQLGLEIQPKGWWDNYLTEYVSSIILKEHRINEDNEIVKDDQGKDM